MKYLNVVLTVIAVFLAAIALRLVQLGITCEHYNEQARFLLKSNQSLIASNQGLQEEIAALRKELGVIRESLWRKTDKNGKGGGE